MSVPVEFKRLTSREEAAIIWGIVTDCQDWKKIYVLARCTDPDDPKTHPKHIDATASRWKHTFAVESFYNNQKLILQAKYNIAQAAEIEKKSEAGGMTEGREEEEEETKSGKRQKITDFSDTKVALAELNRLANLIPDAKAKADAITTIQKLVIQTKTESGEKDIQRFYTPLTCRECAIYRAVKGGVSV